MPQQLTYRGQFHSPTSKIISSLKDNQTFTTSQLVSGSICKQVKGETQFDKPPTVVETEKRPPAGDDS